MRQRSTYRWPMSAPSPFPPEKIASSFELELARGEMLGRFVIVGVLGRGGMGVVYKAYDSQLNRTLAIKLLHRHLAHREDKEELESRMLREAQAMARLNHPNVVVVHDVGMFDGRVFLAMDFVDGGTFKEWMASVPSWRDRLNALKEAGRGLAAAHAAGLIHRDFKPDNVLVGKDGRVYVTDFGLARAADDFAPDPHDKASPSSRNRIARAIEKGAHPSSRPSFSNSSISSPLTVTGSVLGTVGYLAPEQAFREPTDSATDQFSFAATLYQTLYGKKPFPSESIEQYLNAFELPVPPPPPGPVPNWIFRIIQRGLSRKPEDRFPSMEALLAELEKDPAIKARKRNEVLAALLGGVVLVSSIAYGASRRTPRCAEDRGALAGIWDDTVKQDIAKAFGQADAKGAVDLVGRVTRVLDERSERWRAMRLDSCEATRVRGTQPDDEFRLRNECLDRRKSEFRELSASLRTANKEVTERALSAAYGLTSVAVCADIPFLKASAGLPDSVEARDLVLKARARLAAAVPLQLVGKLNESAHEASLALELATKANHGSTKAEALYWLGGIKVEQNDYKGAERLLIDATWTAAKAGADAIVVDSASMAAFVSGGKLAKAGESQIWLSTAESALARLGGSDVLQLDLDERKAWLLAEQEGRPEAAIPIQERVVQFYQRLNGAHPSTLRALYNLGDAKTAVADHAGACDLFGRAVEMGIRVGGENYNWTAYSLAGLGDCRAAQGDFANGDAFLERALRALTALSDEYSEAEALEVVIRSALAQGDFVRAAERAKRALLLMRKLEGTESLTAIVNVPAALALLRVNPNEEVLPLCQAAREAEEKVGLLDASKVLRADALRCEGEALLATKRAKEAIPLFERSLGIPRRTYPGDLARARFGLARAVLAAGGGKAHALALARTAHDELVQVGFLRHEVAETAAFIRKLE